MVGVVILTSHAFISNLDIKAWLVKITTPTKQHISHALDSKAWLMCCLVCFI